MSAMFSLRMRFTLLIACALLALTFVCPEGVLATALKLQTNGGTMTENEVEEAESKITEELEEENQKEAELDDKLDRARDIAEMAEIEEEVAEDAAARTQMEKDREEAANTPEGRLEAMMSELIRMTYRLREVNQKLAVLD